MASPGAIPGVKNAVGSIVVGAGLVALGFTSELFELDVNLTSILFSVLSIAAVFALFAVFPGHGKSDDETSWALMGRAGLIACIATILIGLVVSILTRGLSFGVGVETAASVGAGFLLLSLGVSYVALCMSKRKDASLFKSLVTDEGDDEGDRNPHGSRCNIASEEIEERT